MTQIPNGVATDLQKWLVTTPEIIVYKGCSYCDTPEPDEMGIHYAEVDAGKRREAIILGVRSFLAHTCCEGSHYGPERFWPPEGEHPFSGVKAEVIEPCATHGYDFEDCTSGVCHEAVCARCHDVIPLGADEYDRHGDHVHRGACPSAGNA